MNSETEGVPTTEWSEAVAAADHINNEAVLADLEARYAVLEKERDQLHERSKVESERVINLENKAVALQNALSKAESAFAEVRRDSQIEKDKFSTVEAQQKMQQERITRLEEEGDNLREEISRLNNTNKDINNKLVETEAIAKLNDSLAIPLQYEVERVRKELDALGSHSAWLEQELSNRNDAMVSLKIIHSAELLKLRDNLDQANSDRDQNESKISHLERSNRECVYRTEKMADDLRNHRLEAIAANETAEKELIAERRLVQLQKEQLDRSESRYGRLEKELVALRLFASQASEDTQKQVDDVRVEIESESCRALNDQHEAHQKEIAKLQELIRDANKARGVAEVGLLGSPSNRFTGHLVEGNSDEPLSLTDLYAKINAMEDELNAERAMRKKAELVYQRIHADIAAKTPLLQRQRQEHDWAIEQKDEAQARLQDALTELSETRRESEESAISKTSLEMERNSWKRQTKELAKQVQALLASKAGGDSADGIPLCIEEIQTQNLKLIEEHARLTLVVEGFEEKLRSDKATVLVERANIEIASLREDRQRQDILVSGIVQQRDLYRALLAKHGDSFGESFGGTNVTQLVAAQQTEQTARIEEHQSHLEEELVKIRSEVLLITNDRNALDERIARCDAYTSELTSSIDKLQNELLSVHSVAARSQAEGGFFRDKCMRVEESLQSTRDERQKIQEGKKELQKLNASLQQSLASADAEVAKCHSTCREAEKKARLAEAQAQIAKASELRLNVELDQVRSVLTRQGDLVETVRKIEASLTARNEEEKEKLLDSCHKLSQMLEKEKSKHATEVENLQYRVRELEIEIKLAEAKKSEVLQECIAARKEVADVQELSAKCDTLQAQLALEKEKLKKGAIDDSEITLVARMEFVNEELEKSTADLVAAKARVIEFQKIAKSSENALGDLTETTEHFKKESVAEIEELNKRIDAIKKENQDKQFIIIELTNDLCKKRSEQETEIITLKNQISCLTNEVDNAKRDAESVAIRADTIASEMETYRSEATRAQNNYERELSLHAIARTELRKATESVATEQSLRGQAEQCLERLNADVAEREIVILEEITTIKSSANATERLLQETRGHNEALHKQLATLSDQIEKSQTVRLEAAVVGDDGATLGTNEADELRKTISESREVIRYMRAEHEMIQAQVDSARRTADRERAATAVVMRSLDEARVEMKLLQENEALVHQGLIGSDQAIKLKNADIQITLLRESNQLLRDETAKFETSLERSQSELSDIKSRLVPTETYQHDLEVQRSVLEAEKSSLQRELETWKGRLQSMVSKFNTIDPEEHKMVIEQVEKLKKEASALKAQKSLAEKETASAKTTMARLNTDLSLQKSLVDKQNIMLVKLKSDMDSATKSSSALLELTMERNQLKEKIVKMDFDAKSTITELNGANQRNEMLKNRMRQFQVTLNKQTNRIEELEKQLSKETAQVVKETADHVAPPQAEKETGMDVEKEPTKPELKVMALPSQEVKPVNLEMKGKPAAAPEGGFNFGPGGKSKLLEKKNVEDLILLSTEAPVHTMSKETRKVPAQGLPPIEAHIQEKVVIDSCPQQEYPRELQSKTDIGLAPKVSSLRSNSPMRDKVETQSEGNDSEAAKKKALIAKLNEKKRKLAEAQAHKKAQLVKGPSYKVVAEDNGEVQEKTIEEESGIVNEPSFDTHTQITKASKSDEETPEPLPTSETSTFERVDVEQQEPQTKKAKKGEAPTYETVSATEEPASKQEIIDQPMAAKAIILEKRFQDDGANEAAFPVALPSGATEIPFDAAPKVLPMAFASLISSELTVGSGAITSGSSTFGTPTTSGSHSFGSSASIKPFSEQSELVRGASTELSTGFSGSSFAVTSAFLTNMKPPSSNAAPFSFGTSSGPIMLPTPSNPQPPTLNPFGAFSGSPFGGGSSHGQPLFGSSSNVKRSSPLEKANNNNTSNQAQLEEDQIDVEIEGASGENV